MLTGREAFISCCDYYCKALKTAVSKGQKWVYSNSGKYVRQLGTFDDMIKAAKKGDTKYKGGNCASLANWAFRDMGIIPEDLSFYGDANGKIYNYNDSTRKLKKKIDSACKVISTGGKKFSTLLGNGTVKAGDILIGKGHTFIYSGDGKLYESGRAAKDVNGYYTTSLKTEYDKTYVFKKWKIKKEKSTYDLNKAIYYIIRIKKAYIPKTYRDAAGKIVTNK